MRYVIDDVNKVLRNVVFQNKDQLLCELLLNWPSVVGIEFSGCTTPVHVRRTKKNSKNHIILHVKISNPAISTKFIFHQGVIMERISTYMGFQAVHAIRVC